MATQIGYKLRVSGEWKGESMKPGMPEKGKTMKE